MVHRDRFIDCMGRLCATTSDCTRVARHCAAFVASHVSTVTRSEEPSSQAAVQLLCELAQAGCVSPEALHKMAWLAWCESSAKGDAIGGNTLPTSLDVYTRAIVSSRMHTITHAMLNRVLAPLMRRPPGDDRATALASAMQEVLHDCVAPQGDDDGAPLLPGHLYFPIGAAAFTLCCLLSPEEIRFADGRSPDDPAWDAVCARLATYARYHGKETPHAGLLCAGLMAALASPDGCSTDWSPASSVRHKRAFDLLARILAEQRGLAMSAPSVSSAVESDNGEVDPWWNAVATQLCDAALFCAASAPAQLDASPLPIIGDRGDHLTRAAASAARLDQAMAPCARLLSQLVTWHAAAYARSGDEGHLKECTALLTAFRLAGKTGGMHHGAHNKMNSCSALILADACAALEPAVRAGAAWCAPGMPPPLGVSVTAFCGALREGPRRHLWWVFLPLCCVPYRTSAAEVLQSWAASVGHSSAHVEAASAAVQAWERAGNARQRGATPLWEDLALYAITVTDAQGISVVAGPVRLLLGTDPDPLSTGQLFTWLMLRLHAAVASDAAILRSPGRDREARMRALCERAKFYVVDIRHAALREALTEACAALTGALDAIAADIAHIDAQAAAVADTPASKRRRADESGAVAHDSALDEDTYALQTDALDVAAGSIVSMQSEETFAPTLVALLNSSSATVKQRAHALHLVARALCCDASQDAGLRQMLLATEEAKTAEMLAALGLCRHMQMLL